MYKYQEETLEYLTETRTRLEKLTDSKMTLKIGLVRDEYLNSRGTEYYEDTRDLYLCLNYGETFMTVGDYHTDYGVSRDAVVRLNNNLFLKLNNFIDKIYKNKKEREEFHDRLNLELQSLNKSLVVVE